MKVAIVGGGPAGLMAAHTLAQHGISADVYDAMPSVGRKFLLAGRGGLNLTHSEDLACFVARYGECQSHVAHWLAHFGPQALRQWSHELGQPTFVGSSGRVFPTSMKAAPLLRAWLQQLRASGVRFHMRHRWLGWGQAPHEAVHFQTEQGPKQVQCDAIVLALGGGSWPQLGSDGRWVSTLEARGIAVAPLLATNCGFDVGPTPWSNHFQTRYAGHPLKAVGMQTDASPQQIGECVVTGTGLEGGLVYGHSKPLRMAIAQHGSAVLHLDLLPQRSLEWVYQELTRPRGPRSLSTHLKSRLGLHGVKAGLLYECVPHTVMQAASSGLAQFIKHLPVTLCATRPLAEAISTAGGVCFDSVDEGLMLHALPGVYCAGEMLDWEAPTGGYLLNACLASGRVAALAVAKRLGAVQPRNGS
jgi:uncharacterized flavoprotein (TIGR03862 family)